MSHVDPGPLATYSSLQDKHLVGYFNNSRMRRHLRRSGLVTRNGEIITENTFRMNMARKEHQKHVRDLMAQAIVHKALDMERHRQSQIKRKLEEISKVELVHRVKSTRGRKGDEDITPYLSPRAPQGRPKSAKQERPRSVVSGHRPATAPSKHAGATKKKSSVYVDPEGFPVHRDQAWAAAASDSSEEIDSQNLRELDPYVMNNVTLNMSPEERRGNSPYKVDLTLPPEPRPPTRAPPGSRKTPRGSARSVITKDGRRIRPKSNKGSLSLHRKEPAYPHAAQQQTLCDVTIRYRGSNLKLQYERQDKRDEIVINQQHCGGGNLVVFHGLVEPGTDLVFTSRRHRGYPFSLTFFLNQIQVLRLSGCCEYKYGPGVLLGGRKGHFKFGRVDGGSPCYRCMVEAELARRERQRYKDTQTEEPKPEPEPEPVLESQGTQSDPPPPETRDQNEQAQADEEAKEAEGGYDDEDFEDEDVKEDGAQADSKKEDAAKNSDHFFSGPESDAEQKQPDDVDYDADSDFEVESKHGKQKEEENEKDEEVKEEVNEEEEVKEEADEEDALKEASEEEPIHSEIEEADEGNKEDVSVPQELIKEEDETHEIPEEKEPQVKEADKHNEGGHQSSAHDDSDWDSDGEDHNKVLPSSSSSFSSSEDDADQKVPDTIVTSSSDSDSDGDADRKTKEVEQDKDDIKKEEIPSKDEENDVVREEEEVEVKEERPSSSLTEDPGDTKDRKTDQEADDDNKEENNASKEKQEEEDKEESDKEDKSLVDKIKSMFTSSDSDSSSSSSSDSSSDSDSDRERKKKKKHRKKKREAKKKDTPVPVEIKSGSDSDREKRSKIEKSDSEKEDIKAEGKEEEMQDDAIIQDDTKEDGDMPADVDHSEDDKEKIYDVIIAHQAVETGAVPTMQEEKEDQQSEEPDRDEDSQSQSERLVSEEENDKENRDIVSFGKDTSLENRNDGDAQTKDDSEKPESDIENEDQKSEEPDRDEDSQSQSDRLVRDEEKDEEKGDTASPRNDTASENMNNGDDQTKDDPEKPESDIEKEDQKSEEPDRDEDSQSQSDRLVRDEEKDEEKGDTASPRNDTASENMGDGDAQTKDDHEKLESDVGKRLAPTVQIEEATSDAEEQKEEGQDANKVTSEDGEDDEKEAGDSDKIDEDDEKQTTDTEKEDVLDDKSEEDNDAGKQIMSSDEKEADEEQNTTEDKDATEKEEESKEEAVQGDEDREQKEEVEVKDEDKTEDGPKEEEQKEGSLTSRSSVSDSGSIAAGLDNNYRILNLNAKNLDERKARKLAKALKQQKYRNLEYLLLRENPLTDEGLATIIRSLIERHKESTSADSALKLTHLDLGNSGMGDESADELARLLTLDTQLRNLNISENELSTAAWASIIDHVKTNKSLVTFSAEYAHLSDTSCVMLMEALAAHEILEELNIEGNGLGERAGKAVVQLVKDNSVITSLNFERDNSISPKILAEVKEILETGSYVP